MNTTNKEIPSQTITMPESTGALIAELAAEAAYEVDQGRGMLQRFARAVGQEKTAARMAYERFLEQNWRSSGKQEDRLHSALKRLGLEKILKLYDKIVASMSAEERKLADREAKNGERVRAIMSEIDTGRSNLLKQDSDGANVALSAGNAAIADALKSGIQAQASVEQVHAVSQTINHGRLQAAMDGQKAAIQKQLAALQKAKLFGKFMPFVKILIQAAVMALFSLTGIGVAVGAWAQKLTAQLADTVVGKIVAQIISRLASQGIAEAQNQLTNLGVKAVAKPTIGAQQKKIAQGQQSQSNNQDLVNDIMRQISEENESHSTMQQDAQKTNDRLEQALNAK